MTATTAPATATHTTTTATPAHARNARRHALVSGIFYLLTFAASIPAVILLAPILKDPNYIVGAGADGRVLWGCILDVVNALAGIGTAVAIFPVVRRHGEAAAAGFITARMFEAAVILTGVVCLGAVVTMRQDPGAADAATLVTTGHALVEVRNWTFLLGPSLMPVFSALLFGSLLYRSRLVPRAIPALGLIGAPLLLAGTTATMFGLIEPFSIQAFFGTLLVATWEFSVGVYMIVKGVRPSALANERNC
jgi:hypothetical protein